MSKQKSWDVWLGNKLIDTVWHDARDGSMEVKRSLIDHDGYVLEIEVVEAGKVPTYPGGVRPRRALWSIRYELARFGHSCRYNTVQKVWIINGTHGAHDIECDDWRRHRGRRGNPGFLRFIHAMPDQLHNTDLASPFISGHYPHADKEDRDVLLWIAHEGMQTEDGLHVYCEVYLLDDERGVNPTFRVFLNGDDGWAQIECYDDRYVEVAKMAAAAVEQGYTDEEAA